MADKKRPSQIAAYNKIVKAAEKAGSPDPQLTASIAMLESGWMTSEFAKKNNPFGQTIYNSQVGKKGIISGRRAADGLLTAEYDSLDSAMKHHMDKWGEYYVQGDPEKSLKNLVDNSYNVVDPKWADKIYSIHTGPTTEDARREYSLDTEIDRTLDPTAQALGLPTSEDLQSQLQSYNDIKDYDEAVASGQADFTLVNPNYDPNRPQAEQYLDSHPELTEYFQGADNIPSVPSGGQPSADDDSRSMSDIIGLKMGAYEDLLSLDKQIALDPERVSLPNPDYDPNRPLAEQYLEFNPDIRPLIERSADPSTPSLGGDATGDPTSTATGATGRASGYEGMSAEELQGMYQGLLDADAAAAAGDGVYPLVNDDFEPGPQAPQFLERRMQGVGSANPSDPNFVGPTEMSGEALVKEGYEERPTTVDPVDPERRKPNLGNMDYMGMLSSLGSYAARTGPLRRALKEAQEWDEVKYPRYNPALLDGTVPKRDVRDAYTTAMSTAGDQGKLDLGALALLATKQAQEVSRVEENLSNQNNQIKNQAQQLNNQITMQEMNDTAANKGAAATMRNQIYADWNKMNQGSIREYNMARNDANVKNMFAQVFGDEFSQNNIT